VPISRRILADDEEVLVDLRPHWVFLAGPAALTAVAVAAAVTVAVEFPSAPVGVAGVLAAMIGVPALWLVGRVVRWLSISLVVTTTRIVLRHGVFSRDMVQVRLQRVAEVHCRQSLVERVIGSGRLVIELVGDQPLALDDVRRPRALQRVITRQLDELEHGGTYGGGLPWSNASAEPTAALGSHTAALGDTPPHGVASASMSTAPHAPTWPLGAPTTSTSSPTSPFPAGIGDRPAEIDAWGGSPKRQSDAPPSIPERLIQLDDLRRRGIISDDEFQTKKAELLDRL
jgi:membrane protein YdbS with pleckstrin-like domain